LASAALRPAGNRRARAYVEQMATSRTKLGTLATIALVAVLLAILAAAGWYAARAWIEVSGPPMPATGYVAMALGVVFSLVVGCGLMALLFYSSRHGYDEPYRPDDDHFSQS
jgi:uncharacterized membrane protein YidH (DUF202 family)